MDTGYKGGKAEVIITVAEGLWFFPRSGLKWASHADLKVMLIRQFHSVNDIKPLITA